ncbi:MAG: DMT family transporter [Cetobacterium sp.]|uniref:DMT family transporter n=1 Tax=Cetobacterium sp. TaxID=2071632 RepID=UPI003F2EE3E2
MESNLKKGLFFGGLVGFAWGLDTVLMGLVGNITILKTASSSTLISAFLHDAFCFLWLALVAVFNKKFIETFKLLKTKKGKVTFLAALVGAPIGMSGYVIGIKYAAPAYASSLSVIYPGVGAILSYFILKEKLSKRAIIGIIVSLIGSVALGYSKVDLNMYPDFYKGMAFTLLAVFGWALEGVIIGYAMKKIKDEKEIVATPQQFLTIRYLTSFIAYGVIIMPIIDGYKVVGHLALNGEILYFSGIAILGTITYLSWYKAVNYIGASMGTALNSTAAFWAIIFSNLILGTEITPYLALCGLIIIVGVFIFAVDFKEFFGKKIKIKN